MLKKLTILLTLVVLFAACNNQKEENAPEETQEETVKKLEIATFFQENDEELDGKEVELVGNVVHVCKHGGKRMFIIDDNPDHRLKITTGEGIGEFKVDLEGSKVKVHGIIEEERIDKKYLDEWEEEVLADAEAENMKLHEGKEGHEEEHEDAEKNQENQLKRIKELREQLEAASKDYISFYSIKASNFEEIK